MVTRRQGGARGPKQKNDNIIILYSIIFCIVLVIYIRFVM